MTLEIGRFTEADRPRWTELWRAYLGFYDTIMPRELYDHTWSRLQADQVLHAFAARHDGEIIGLTHFLYHESGWTLRPVCYLQDLYVDPAARTAGVGRALIEAVGAHARARQTTRMYWLTQDHNLPARRLYDRIAKHNGFIRYDYETTLNPAE